MNYLIQITHAAQCWCVAHQVGLDELQKRCRAELAQEGFPEENRLSNLAFHTFTWSGSFFDGSQNFIITPINDRAVKLDTAREEEAGTVEAGPFKGKKIILPVGDDD